MIIEYATVIWPVTLRNIEVPDNATLAEQRSILFQAAAGRLTAVEAVVHDASDDVLID